MSAEQTTATLRKELDGLWSFIEHGCDARQEDKHHALQSLDAIKALLSETRRIPNVDELTVQELRALQGRINLLLQHKVCGDPVRGVIVNGIPTNEDPPSLR